MNIVLVYKMTDRNIVSVLALIIAICDGATKILKNQAYLQTQPTVNAIIIDVFDATPALLAFFSPRRFPILVIYKKSKKKRQKVNQQFVPRFSKKEKKGPNRTEAATPKANGAW